MGSGFWFKAIISLRNRKSRDRRSKKAKGTLAQEKLKSNKSPGNESTDLANGNQNETTAATRIQTAFRAYKARKALRRLKGFTKLKNLTQGYSIQKQASTTITYLHSWSKIQGEIRARRICMVTEERIKRKKQESQLKLEEKLHDFEVEWSGGPETAEETLGRIHQRGEAAVKRERAMAYAFSHQWRANSSQSQVLGSYELGRANWGWSWKERWIAARPWESRVATISPKKTPNKQSFKAQKDKNTSTSKTPVSVTPPSSNTKGTPPPKGSTKGRRLSFPTTEKEKTLVEGVK
ncbi:protein IQ-DOMAIN 9-like [Vicia villosa]|uniref:protein IQ-DOMAIN 9-like n=1 Tax=Vicia villosa TaxID=3911 RepID=UPI00273B2E46|nr:protein IQ-DOMAIN 9-like [Vicia villosa]